MTARPILSAGPWLRSTDQDQAAVQLLTFPGVFTATGLLGANPHTADWLYMLWHGRFPLMVILYALFRGKGGEMTTPPHVAVTFTVAAAIGAVFACWFASTWLAAFK